MVEGVEEMMQTIDLEEKEDEDLIDQEIHQVKDKTDKIIKIIDVIIVKTLDI